MPIPELLPEQPASAPARPSLHLVPSAPARPEPLWYSRVWAHLIDLVTLSGCGIYLTKVITLGLVSLHLSRIQATAKPAMLFQEAYDYGQGAVGSVVFAVLMTLYFVALPALFGQTLGLGLYGLRIEAEGGGPADPRALARRLLVSLLAYASFGLLFLTSLRNRDGRFPQDRWTETRVTRLPLEPTDL